MLVVYIYMLVVMIIEREISVALWKLTRVGIRLDAGFPKMRDAVA